MREIDCAFPEGDVGATSFLQVSGPVQILDSHCKIKFCDAAMVMPANLA